MWLYMCRNSGKLKASLYCRRFSVKIDFVILYKQEIMEVIEQVPKTALDVFRILPEGTLCEVIDNVLYRSPAPKYNHQRLVTLFTIRIRNYVEAQQKGTLIASPFDVYLENLLSAVQPDILYVS